MGMFLYSTVLLIHNYPVSYQVSRQQGDQFLLFKPEHPYPAGLDFPIFWVAKQQGQWTPVNVQDPALYQQVVDDIQGRRVE